jgi:hypothetical protein
VLIIFYFSDSVTVAISEKIIKAISDLIGYGGVRGNFVSFLA